MAKTQSVYDVHPSVAMMQSWVAELNTSLRVPDHPRTDFGKAIRRPIRVVQNVARKSC